MTPPVGIYSRSWGAATHDVAEGVHRPLTATAAVFAPLAGDGPTLALVALDVGWFPYGPDELGLRAAIMERSGLGEAELLVQLSHTHAGANTNSRLEGRPGAELIAPYLDRLDGRGLRRGGRGAIGGDRGLRHLRAGPLRPRREPGLLGRRRGAVRVRLQPGRRGGRHAHGRPRHRRQRPDARDALQLRLPPDHARVGEPAALARLRRCGPRGAGGRVRRACALPPGRLGRARAARRLRRRPGRGRPERAPAGARRRGGDRGAPTAGHALRLHGDRRVRREPRHLGVPARARPSSSPRRADSRRSPPASTSSARRTSGSSRASRAPLPTRRRSARRRCGGSCCASRSGTGPVHRMPIWAWRLGEALLLAVPNEPYSVFQVELRRRFAGTPVLVLMTTNGGVGYLPPRETYGSGRYQEQQSPYAPGCLEEATEAAAVALEPLRPAALVVLEAPPAPPPTSRRSRAARPAARRGARPSRRRSRRRARPPRRRSAGG